MFTKNLEIVATDLPNGARRIGIGTLDRETRVSEVVGQLDFFGALAEIARKSPTFQRELTVFLMSKLNAQ